jgi:hypothetical protein
VKPKDPGRDILVMAMVVFVNLITVSFIHWAFEGYFPGKIGAFGIFFYAVTVFSLLIFDLSYIRGLYIEAKTSDKRLIRNHQVLLKQFKIINITSLIMLSVFVMWETYLRGSCIGCGSKPSCSYAETDAMNTMAALSAYYAEPGRTDVPSIKTLVDVENLSLNGTAYIFGDVPSSIMVIVSDATKKCPRGNYYVTRMSGDSVGYWLVEWPDDLPKPLTEETAIDLSWLAKLLFLIPLIPFLLFYRWYHVTVHHRNPLQFIPIDKNPQVKK